MVFVCDGCRARRKGKPPRPIMHMSHSVNSIKGVRSGIIYGIIIGVIKGETRSLDYGSYGQ